MKHIIFTYNDLPSINIGDYIQSLAAKQYVNSDIVYVNRDELSEYNGEEAQVIMNGWYTYKPYSCMPNKCITPLFVAFHLNVDIEKEFLNSQNIAILQKYAPIGCRDVHTVEVLQSKGIDAYFSGCLTTTLGYDSSYKSTIKNNGIFIVDPYSYLPNGNNLFELLKTMAQFVGNCRSVIKLIGKYKQDNPFRINFSKVGVGRFLLVTKTYVLLKKILEKDMIWKARYITQWYMNDEYPTDELRFKRADELLHLYAGAKYVITSRIHCAFPCLGLNTPVAFIKNNAGGEKSTCRLGSVSELFNVIELNNEKVVSTFLHGKFSLNTIFSNKKIFMENRDRLIKKCTDFVKY